MSRYAGEQTERGGGHLSLHDGHPISSGSVLMTRILEKKIQQLLNLTLAISHRQIKGELDHSGESPNSGPWPHFTSETHAKALRGFTVADKLVGGLARTTSCFA